MSITNQVNGRTQKLTPGLLTLKNTFPRSKLLLIPSYSDDLIGLYSLVTGLVDP